MSGKRREGKGTGRDEKRRAGKAREGRRYVNVTAGRGRKGRGANPSEISTNFIHDLHTNDFRVAGRTGTGTGRRKPTCCATTLWDLRNLDRLRQTIHNHYKRRAIPLKIRLETS